MNSFTGFETSDFEVFATPNFHERMSQIRMLVRPKLIQLGNDLAPGLTQLVGHPMIPHVASHARRRINPPDDTWVAFSRSPRGYKRYAHFEVGISQTGIFVRFVIKPEGDDDKPNLLRYLDRGGSTIFDLKDPSPIYWYRDDHGHEPRAIDQINGALFEKVLQDTRLKSRGFSVGVELPRTDLAVRSAALVTRSLNICTHLAPLYQGTLMAAELA